MPCYTPIKGWYARKTNPSGKRSIVFDSSLGHHDRGIDIPCGQCIGCRLERAREWAIRCTHEASLYDLNCFITLTYRDEDKPVNGSLVPSHFVDFMKRLRRYVAPLSCVSAWMSDFGRVVIRRSWRPWGVRFFHCGEYGEQLARPHHHACLFNFDFHDKYFFRVSNGFSLFRSPTLERLWPFGYSTIGAVTFETASYVAGYVSKKITGPAADAHYGGRAPEYVTMSRRPGIGARWFELYHSDVFPSDEVVLRGGIKCRPPKYYDSIFDLTSPDSLRILKGKRMQKAKENVNLHGERLMVKGTVKLLRHQSRKRRYEYDGVGL
nr:MAG: replication initiator protein [Microvirus sp.]